VTDLPATAEELGELAQQGAIALVAAMATGAFQAARSGIGRLFGRLGRERQTAVEAQLDDEETLVAQADSAGRDEVREALVPAWGLKLARLLKDQPAAEQELRELLAQIQAVLPNSQQQWVQNIIASGSGSSAYGTMFGDVHHYDLAGKQATSTPDPSD
jgi:hypothetical protein